MDGPRGPTQRVVANRLTCSRFPFLEGGRGHGHGASGVAERIGRSDCDYWLNAAQATALAEAVIAGL